MRVLGPSPSLFRVHQLFSATKVVSEFNSVLVDGDNVAWFLRKMAETAEQYKR